LHKATLFVVNYKYKLNIFSSVGKKIALLVFQGLVLVSAKTKCAICVLALFSMPNNSIINATTSHQATKASLYWRYKYFVLFL